MLKRTYATSRQVVSHTHHGLHAWPASKQPTPHEIFGLDNGQPASRLEFDKQIKKTYQKLVKMYHPDVSSQVDILHADGHALSGDQKRARLEQIRAAYDVLRDPKNKAAFERAQTTTWSDYKRGQTGSFDAYRMANAHRRKYSYENDPKFWQAGTWEDYYQMRYGRPAPTMEEWERNKWSILWKVLAVATVVVALQIMLALERTADFNRETRLMNLRANADLQDAYANYQEGLSRFQRIRRFLLYRRSGLDERDTDGSKTEENEMLTKYAQEQVKKI